MSIYRKFAAAFFVQHVVTSYDTHFAALESSTAISSTTGDIQANDDPIGKECSNLVVLLSELYNFQVISCVLMYDVIRALLDGDLTEFKVELLLKVARSMSRFFTMYIVLLNARDFIVRLRSSAQTGRPDRVEEYHPNCALQASPGRERAELSYAFHGRDPQ